MSIENCFEAVLRIREIDEEVCRLSDKLKKVSNPAFRKNLEKKIDALEVEFLTLKHKMERIKF